MMQPVDPPSTQRPRLGAMISIMERYQSFWAGIADGAFERGANLICYLGGTVWAAAGEPRVVASSAHNIPSASFYDQIDTGSLDALVTWAGSGVALGMNLSEAQMEQFIARFRALPIVNYEGTIAGAPTVQSDTYAGMCELLAHMIECHGHRRIALLRGPQHHLESEQRHQAYLDTLARYGIPIRPELISSPLKWGDAQGIQAACQLLDERGLRPGADIDAIVASEIEYALGALQELQSRGVRVPEEIALASFNDRIEAQLAHPPITAVAKPFRESGRLAAHAALDMAAGLPQPAVIAAPPRLMVRRSCGCWKLPPGDDLEAALAAQLRGVVDSPLTHPRLAKLAGALAQGYQASDRERWRGETWALLSETLRQRPRDSELLRWHATIAELRSYFAEAPATAEPLCQQVRAVLEIEQRHTELEIQSGDASASRDLLAISQEMMSSQSIDQLLDVLVHRLPALGITGCYLSLSADRAGADSAQRAPEWSQLALALQDGHRLPIRPETQRFRSSQLTPDGYLPSDRAYAVIVTPLHFGRHMFGSVLFEVGPSDGMLYVLLAQEISSALQSVFLLRDYQEAERARRESEARMHALVEHMPIAFWAKDVDGRYILQNSALRALIGDAVGMTIDQVAIGQAERSTWQEEDARVLAGETLYVEREVTQGGRTRIFNQVIAPVELDGQITAMIGLMLDITAQRQIEASLRQAKEAAEAADRAKGIVLANISHEFRTPLHGILGYTQVLLSGADLSPQQQRGLSAIQRSGEHLLLLINDILDLARLEAGKVALRQQRFRLHDTLQQVCDIVQPRAEAKQLGLQRALGALPAVVIGDEHRLRQILVNLLGNAIKFTSQGDITLLAETLPSGEVRFQVTDTGVGIAPEHLDAIFTPFEQAGAPADRERGTGLGLSIARELVSLMGGQLHVLSAPGRGSSFWFDIALPAHDPQPGEEPPAPPQREAAAAGEAAPAQGAPPAALIAELAELARIGDIDALQRRVALAIEEDPGQARFLHEVRQLADSFQIQLLRTFLAAQGEGAP